MVSKSEFDDVLPPLNVLVVDDGLANRVLARGLLSRDGHQVTLVENGLRAVQRLLDTPFDVVLMDIDMPVMDGLSATRAIRRYESTLGRHTPVIALSSNAEQEKCAAAGIDALLNKPLDMNGFRRIVSSVLEQRAA